MKWKKSETAGILFGLAMGVLFYQTLGTPGIALGVSFAILGREMFKGLDNDKK